MSTPSIASKLTSLVKGIFGQKETESATVAEPVATPAQESAEAQPHAERETVGAVSTSRAGESERSAPEPQPDSGVESTVDPESEPELVAPEEKAEVAEELSTAEATTEVASDDVLEDVRQQSAPAAEELPVTGYDELTLPSIRGRLRKFSIDQVRDLRAYEVAHANRSEFVKMYDNRIAKLQAEAG